MRQRASQLLDTLRRAASRLGPLVSEVVFVGGATVPCYVTDPAAPDARTTMDVDLVIAALTRNDYHAFEDRLRQQGFSHDMRDEVICRWRFQDDLVVDVMPTDTSILGFTNPWYKTGHAAAVDYALPGGSSIPIFRLEHFVLSKWEAHKDRGHDDPVMSHDLEDLVTVLNGAHAVEERLLATKKAEQQGLRQLATDILGDSDLREACEWHSAQDAPGRFEALLDLLETLAQL